MRLNALRRRLAVPLVLHGTSGLPDALIRRAIAAGICKFNVNTELREAGLQATESYLNASGKKELVDLMETVIQAMQDPVMAKIRLFGSAGRAA